MLPADAQDTRHRASTECRIHDLLTGIVDGLPDGASVTLPAEAIRGWIADHGTHRANQVPPNETDRLLTAREAADRLGVDPSWLYRRKALPFRVELGKGAVRYSEQGIERHIRARMAA